MKKCIRRVLIALLIHANTWSIEPRVSIEQDPILQREFALDDVYKLTQRTTYSYKNYKTKLAAKSAEEEHEKLKKFSAQDLYKINDERLMRAFKNYKQAYQRLRRKPDEQAVHKLIANSDTPENKYFFYRRFRTTHQNPLRIFWPLSGAALFFRGVLIEYIPTQNPNDNSSFLGNFCIFLSYAYMAAVNGHLLGSVNFYCATYELEKRDHARRANLINRFALKP
jgi:hypothetical protein